MYSIYDDVSSVQKNISKGVIGEHEASSPRVWSRTLESTQRLATQGCHYDLMMGGVYNNVNAVCLHLAGV